MNMKHNFDVKMLPQARAFIKGQNKIAQRKIAYNI